MRPGHRESPFLKWGSPPRANDSNEVHSGEEHETGGSTLTEPTPELLDERVILLQTIEEEDEQGEDGAEEAEEEEDAEEE